MSWMMSDIRLAASGLGGGQTVIQNYSGGVTNLLNIESLRDGEIFRRECQVKGMKLIFIAVCNDIVIFCEILPNGRCLIQNIIILMNHVAPPERKEALD